MKKGKNNKVFLSLAYTILIFGIFFILWIKYGNASLPEAVVGAIVPSAIANFIIPSDINLIVLIKELLEILGNKEQDVDFGIREKGVKYIIGAWAIGFLAVSCFVVGYIANKWNMISDTPIVDAAETEAPDKDRENIEDEQNDRLPEAESAADTGKDTVWEEPQDILQNTHNDEAEDEVKITETKDDEGPDSLENSKITIRENETAKDTETFEDMAASIRDEINRIFANRAHESTDGAEAPGMADNKESPGSIDSSGEHVSDNKNEALENSRPSDPDETPDDSGANSDEGSEGSKTVADALPGVSGPTSDASPGVSGPIADASPGVSGPNADATPGVSGPIADAKPEVSGPVANTSPGISGPIADANPGVSGSTGDPGPVIDAGAVPDGSDSIETKPEETQPPEPDDGAELPEQRNDCIVPAIEKKEGEAVRRLEKEKTVTEQEADNITVISGETKIFDKIYRAGKERRYCFRPDTSGTYYFEIISEKDCSEYSINFRRENNNEEVKREEDNNGHIFESVLSEENIPVNLNAGEEYFICINQPWGFGGYELRIKYPEEPEDISDFNSFKNHFSYLKEEHVYLMTPKRTGCYRLDISGVDEDNDVCISVCGETEETGEYTGNKDGLTIKDMQANVTYRIIISQDKGFGPYDLQIGWQKETVSLDGYTGAKDSIQYQDQLNKYEFTAEESGTWNFKVLDIKDDLEVDLVIFGADGKEIDSCHCIRGGINKLEADAEKGEQLTIGVWGMKGTGDYILDYKVCPNNELEMD